MIVDLFHSWTFFEGLDDLWLSDALITTKYSHCNPSHIYYETVFVYAGRDKAYDLYGK